MAVDLKRVQEYINLGFEKEDALKMVKEEEAEEPTEPEDNNTKIEDLKKEIEDLKAKKEEPAKKIEVDNKDVKKMTTDEAFKNIFLG